MGGRGKIEKRDFKRHEREQPGDGEFWFLRDVSDQRLLGYERMLKSEGGFIHRQNETEFTARPSATRESMLHIIKSEKEYRNL